MKIKLYDKINELGLKYRKYIEKDFKENVDMNY